MAYYNYNAAARLPMVGPAADAAFLLGLGPLPPATPHHLAVAQMQAALNSGMFDQTRHFEEDQEDDEDEDDIDNPQTPASTAQPQIDPALLALSTQQGTKIELDARH
ncbi:hypothetical protein FB451DRAFT_1170454 [Mycena latifolia]|nr:hypothetical protein FB451DRAFT_1170454 [Mycena latifolia]